MKEQTKDDVRAAVREEYGSIARSTTGASCAPGCCGARADASLKLGYAAADLDAVPEDANMGLGCGNPHAIAALEPGEVVLDLGAGGGFDCFLAAKQVGPAGKVIGVDMTADMVAKARVNAQKLGAKNVEFRLGEIEHLPVADNSVDVILSNCVINLSPDKAAVFQDAFSSATGSPARASRTTSPRRRSRPSSQPSGLAADQRDDNAAIALPRDKIGHLAGPLSA